MTVLCIVTRRMGFRQIGDNVWLSSRDIGQFDWFTPLVIDGAVRIQFN